MFHFLKLRRIKKIVSSIDPYPPCEEWFGSGLDAWRCRMDLSAESLLGEGSMCFDVLFECLCESAPCRPSGSGDREATALRQAAERALIWMGEAAIEPALKRMSFRISAKPRLGYDPVARVLAGLGVKAVPKLISNMYRRIPGDVDKLEDDAEVACAIDALRQIGTPALKQICDLAGDVRLVPFSAQALKIVATTEELRASLRQVLVEKLEMLLKGIGAEETLQFLLNFGCTAIEAFQHFYHRCGPGDSDINKTRAVEALIEVGATDIGSGVLFLQHAVSSWSDAGPRAFLTLPQALQEEALSKFNDLREQDVLSHMQFESLNRALQPCGLTGKLTIATTAYHTICDLLRGDLGPCTTSSRDEQDHALRRFRNKYSGCVLPKERIPLLRAWVTEAQLLDGVFEGDVVRSVAWCEKAKLEGAHEGARESAEAKPEL